MAKLVVCPCIAASSLLEVQENAGDRRKFPIPQPLARSSLTAGHAHVARQCRLQVPAVDHEIMSFWLARNCLVDRGIEEFVAPGGTQGLAQIGSGLLGEKHRE